jgi:proteasome lid subunit RPN8/RPN11
MRITHSAMEQVRAHAAEGYPEEVCGILIAEPSSNLVMSASRVRNLVVDRARDRYELDPAEQLRIQRWCDEEGLEIAGYYHSHPDHPALASKTDDARCWAGPVYLIISCSRGRPGEANAFKADRDGGPLRPQPLETVD